MAETEPDKNGVPDLGVLAEELNRESERLRQLAAELKAREAADAEMRANYQEYKRALLALLREKFGCDGAPPDEDKDLESVAAEMGAIPLEDFIDELEQIMESPNDAK
jgi:hypothetical protein